MGESLYALAALGVFVGSILAATLLGVWLGARRRPQQPELQLGQRVNWRPRSAPRLNLKATRSGGRIVAADEELADY